MLRKPKATSPGRWCTRKQEGYDDETEDYCELTFKTLICHKGTPIFKVSNRGIQIRDSKKGRIRWRIGFDSGKREPLQIIWSRRIRISLCVLYSNQWDLVNQNEISPGGNKLINDLKDLEKAYFHRSFEPILERSCVLDKRIYHSRKSYNSPGQSAKWAPYRLRAINPQWLN
jgi:hypothetical protein